MLGLDLAGADRDSILGEKPNLTGALPTTLEDLSAALREGRFEEIADMRAEDLAEPRQDTRNALRIALGIGVSLTRST